MIARPGGVMAGSQRTRCQMLDRHDMTGTLYDRETKGRTVGQGFAAGAQLNSRGGAA